jgi:hypothetical protein
VRAANALVALDGSELLAELRDAVTDLSPIELERSLAGAAAALALLSTGRLWKISMMTPVRSSTRAPVARSRFRAWLGVRS